MASYFPSLRARLANRLYFNSTGELFRTPDQEGITELVDLDWVRQTVAENSATAVLFVLAKQRVHYIFLLLFMNHRLLDHNSRPPVIPTQCQPQTRSKRKGEAGKQRQNRKKGTASL